MNSFKRTIKKTNDFFNRRIKLEVIANEEELRTVNKEMYEQIYRKNTRNGVTLFG